MRALISKTFGGLSKQYYFRHFLFSLTLSVICIFSLLDSRQGFLSNFSILSFIVINTFLYPYSRFVYEGIINFIIGNNVLIINSWLSLAIKCFTMIMCWGFSIFIAPIGFLYLYYHFSKTIT